MRFILEERFILNEDEAKPADTKTDAATTATSDTTAASSSSDTTTDNTASQPQGQEPAKQETKDDANTGEAWEKRYSKCTNPTSFEIFWTGSNKATDPDPVKKGFIKSLFGDAAEVAVIKKYANVLIDFLDLYGWDFEDNDLIKFLVYMNKNKPNNVGLKTITPVGARMLEKAFDTGHIAKEDLSGDNAKVPFTIKYNLVYNAKLYSTIADEATQLKYLECQKTFMDKVKNASKATDANAGKVFANLYLDKGNKNVKIGMTDAQEPPSNGELRNVDALKKLLGMTGTSKEQMSLDELTEKITKTVGEDKARQKMALVALASIRNAISENDADHKIWKTAAEVLKAKNESSTVSGKDLFTAVRKYLNEISNPTTLEDLKGALQPGDKVVSDKDLGTAIANLYTLINTPAT